MGRQTTGNCSPLAFHTVITCTAWACDSIRLATTSPSTSISSSDSGGWSRTASSPDAPAIPWGALSWRSSARWSRSVTFLSPSNSPSTRATTPVSAQIEASTSATGRTASSADHAASRSCSTARSSSEARATSSAVQVTNQDSACARTRPMSEGRSIADRRRRTCSAAQEARTLPVPATTAGTPSRRRAACARRACSAEVTRTATSDGRRRRDPSAVSAAGIDAVSRSSRTWATRSCSTSRAARGTDGFPLAPATDGPTARRRPRPETSPRPTADILSAAWAGEGSTRW